MCAHMHAQWSVASAVCWIDLFPKVYFHIQPKLFMFIFIGSMHFIPIFVV